MNRLEKFLTVASPIAVGLLAALAIAVAAMGYLGLLALLVSP